jgi:hypothetical protein
MLTGANRDDNSIASRTALINDRGPFTTPSAAVFRTSALLRFAAADKLREISHVCAAVGRDRHHTANPDASERTHEPAGASTTARVVFAATVSIGLRCVTATLDVGHEQS